MPIIEIGDTGPTPSPEIPFLSPAHDWAQGIDRWDVAKFLLIDVAPYAVGLGVLTSLSKLRYLRTLWKAEQKADKAVDTYKAGQAALDYAGTHYVKTTLFVWGLTSTAITAGTPVYVLYRTADDALTTYIGYRIDRDTGKLISFIPDQDKIRQLKSHRRQDTGLTSTYRSLLNPQGFFTGDGLSHLANTEWRMAPSPKWSPATPASSTRVNRPMTTRPRSGPKGSRPDKITPHRVRGPWCPRHRRRHWCPVTRPN